MSLSTNISVSSLVRFVAAVTLLCSFATAETRHVPSEYSDIQSAINAAVAGDTILVAPGTYYENLVIDGKDLRIVSEAGRDYTIIDGQSLAPVVIFRGAITRSSLLSGFQIINGRATFRDPVTGIGIGAGGGVRIERASPTVEYNYIESNIAQSGGGVFAVGGSPLIRRNYIDGNSAVGTASTAGSGGGVNLQTCINPEVVENTISWNASGMGGGLTLAGFEDAYVAGNRIQNNYASASGGGLLVIGNAVGVATIVQNLMTGNAASIAGGLYLAPTSARSITVVNNTIADNAVTNFGSAVSITTVGTNFINNLLIGTGEQSVVYCAPSMSPSFQKNDVYSVSGQPFGPGVACSPDIVGSNGNFSMDPMFADPSSGNYSLAENSPAIDIGLNSAPGLPEFDLIGVTRILGSRLSAAAVIDLGAYEKLPYTFTFVTVGDSHDVRVLGMNVAGTAVGTYLDENGLRHGFKRDVDGKITGLDVPGAVQTFVRGINNMGVIAGYYEDGDGRYHGFAWERVRAFRRINFAGAYNTQVLGINDLGEMVGVYDTGNPNDAFAALYKSGDKLIPLIVPGTPYAINNAGTVVGDFVGADGINRGFIWNGSDYSTVSVPDAQSTSLLGINNAGVAAGRYVGGAGGNESLIIKDSERLGFAYAGAGATAVFSINDAGVVTGFANFQGERRGMIAVPIP